MQASRIRTSASTWRRQQNSTSEAARTKFAHTLRDLLTKHGGTLLVSELAHEWQTALGEVLDLTACSVKSVQEMVDMCGGCWCSSIDGVPTIFMETKDQIDRRLSSIQRQLHRQGSYVRCDAVVQQACQELGVANLSDLGFGDASTFDTLQVVCQLEGLLSALIQGYMATRHFATIHSLELYLCTRLGRYHDNIPVSSYDSLNMGPITAHPEVLHGNRFKLSATPKHICKIEPFHVVEALVSIIEEDSEHHVGFSKTQFTDTELRERLMQIHCGTSEHELGVRISDNALSLYAPHMKNLVQKNSAFIKDLARTLSRQAQAQRIHMYQQKSVVVERLKQQYEHDHGIALRVFEDLRQEVHSNLIADQIAGPLATETVVNQQCQLGCGSPGRLLPHDFIERTSIIQDLMAEVVEVAWQLWEAADSDLQAFSLSVFRRFYLRHENLQLHQAVGRKKASITDFWQQDLLGSLLMAALMLYTVGVKSTNTADASSKLADLVRISHSIDFNSADVNSRFLEVPGVNQVRRSSRWLCLLWHCLTLASNSQHSSKAVGEDALITQLFAAFVVGSQARQPLRRHQEARLRQFWYEDVLASTLIDVMKCYGRTVLPAVDARAIQQWLIEAGRPATQQAEPTHEHVLSCMGTAARGLPQHTDRADAGPHTLPASSSLELAHSEQQIAPGLEDDVRMYVPAASAVPRDQVISLWHTASSNVKGTNPEETNTVLSKLLCLHFGVDNVEQLGYGSLEIIQQSYASTQQHLSSRVLPLLALVPAATQWGSQNLVIHASAALQHLQDAPVLADLQDWMQWDVRCKATLGPLRDFLQEHGTASGVLALELPNKQLLKVRPDATAAGFKQALDEGDGHAAAAAVLGLVAAEGGLAKATQQLLAEFAKESLGVLRAESPMSVAQIVAVVLASIPALVRATLGGPILLEPIYMAVESEVVFQEHMMQACCKEPLLGMLHSLGTELGIHVWRDYQPQTEPGPLPDQAPGRAYAVEHMPQPVMEAEPMLPAGPQPSSSLESMGSSPGFQSYASETLNVSSGTASASEQTMSPQEYIEHICLTFGEGTEVTPEAAAAIKRANARVGRSAKMLSVDLYAEKTHFMQELVQNADDCRYPPGVRPTADFVFEDNCITLYVNEVGFSKANIKALSDMGLSTKEHKAGFIGQKGIGFKSVHAVSGAPEVRSGGFYISYDREKLGDLGYVKPTWLDANARRPLPSGNVLNTTTAATQIVLPLKQEVVQDAKVLMHKLQDVQPKHLMFLNMLQCLAVTDKTGRGRSTIITKEHLRSGVIDIKQLISFDIVNIKHGPNSEQSQHFLVVKQTLTPITKRAGKSTTDIAVAFLLCKDPPGQQQAYAYLPLRHYGLKFLVQGDFIVTTARDAITDQPWNLELLADVPGVFVRALSAFRQMPAVDSFSNLNQWFHCIPLHNEAKEVFETVHLKIRELVLSTECIPVEGGSWVRPHEAVICHDKHASARQLLNHPALAGLTGVYFVDSRLTVLRTKPDLAEFLSIKQLDVKHLVLVLNQVHQKGLFPDLGKEWCAQVLACLYDMMAEQLAHNRQYLPQIKAFAMILLSSGTWEAVDDSVAGGGLFKPMHSAQPSAPMHGVSDAAQPSDSAYGAKQPQRSVLDLLHRCQLDTEAMHLRLVSADFMTAAGEEHERSLLNMMQLLGVSDVTCQHVINQHILPVFKSVEASTLQPAVLASYLAFIAHSGVLSSGKEAACLLNELRQCTVVATNCGNVRVGDNIPMHFPAGMLGKDMQPIDALIPQHSFHIVSDIYTKDGLMEATLCRKLMLRLGATDFLSARQTLVTDAQTAASLWPDIAAEPGFSITDFSSAEFEAVVQSVLEAPDALEDKQDTLRLILHTLDHQFRADYKPCLVATYTSASGVQEHMPSSFSRALTEQAWLPSTHGQPAMGSALFLRGDSEVQDVFGSHVAYLDADIKTSSGSLLSHLGVLNTVTVTAVVATLKAWSAQDVFETNLQHMSCVYEFLSRRMERSSADTATVLSAFFEHSLIWLPFKKESTSSFHSGTSGLHPESLCNGNEAGNFYGLRDSLCYSDPTELIEGTETTVMRCLQGHYASPQLQRFFCVQLGEAATMQHGPQLLVQPKATTTDYVELLDCLAQQQSALSFEQARHLLLHWLKCSESGELQDADLIRQAVQKRSLLPAEAAGTNRWAAASEPVYLKDDHATSLLFADKQVLFVGLPGVRSAGWQSLHRVLGVPILSECIKKVPRSEGMSVTLDACQHIAAAIPHLQQFLKTHWKSEYCAISEKVAPYIKPATDKSPPTLNFTCAGTLKLDVEYTLSSDGHAISFIVKPDAELCAQKLGTGSTLVPSLWLYLAGKTSASLREAYNKLSIFLTGGKDHAICDFLWSVCDAQKSESDEELKTILNGLEQLSAEEVRWWVPPMHQGTLTQKETPGLSPGVPSAHVDDSHAAPDTAWLAPKPKTKRPPRTDPDKVLDLLPPILARVEDPADPEPSAPRSRMTAGTAMSDAPVHPPTGLSHARHGLHSDYTNINPKPTGSLSDKVKVSDSDSPDESLTPRAAAGSPVSANWTPSTPSPAPTLRQTSRGRDHSNDMPGAPFDMLDFPAPVAAGLVQEVRISPQLMEQEPAFTVSDMTSPDSGHDPDLDLKVGRWGERLVFHSLLEDAEATGSDVLWINQDENRTQPYDIIVTKRGPDQFKEYIEVKSTRSRSKTLLEMSWAEMKKADECREQYTIYRVCGAWSKTPTLSRMNNPVGKSHAGSLKIYMTMPPPHEHH